MKTLNGNITGGISAGSSTIFFRLTDPASTGHSMSTFLICSHMSAWVLISFIEAVLDLHVHVRPLTDRLFPTMPMALMVRFFPASGRVGKEVNPLDLDHVGCVVTAAEL